MTSSRNLSGRSGPLRPALAGLLLAFFLFAAVGTAAQNSTPVPVGSPVTDLSCGERLGIGDAAVTCLTVIHGSSDAGPIDVSIDGSLLFTGVAFGSSTGFVALPAGTYDIRITATSQSDMVLFESPEQNLTPGEAVELAILGSRDAATLAGLTLPIQPDLASPGTAALRIVQAIPDAPPLDIALSSGETLVSGLSPLTASEYLTVPASAAAIEIRPAGSTDVLFPVPEFAAPDQATITVYALGSVTNPTGLILLSVLVPGPGSPTPDPMMIATPTA